MSLSFSIKRDSISPDLARRVKALRDRKPILEAMGMIIASTAKLAFYDPRLRPLPWKAKADGTPATLMKQQVLRRSPRVVSVSNDRVIVGSDRKYAAIHQLGGMITRKAHTRKVRLAVDTAGNLERQAGHKNLAKFAKKKGRAKTVEAQMPERQFYMPARPYFPFDATGKPMYWLRAKLDNAVRRKLGLQS